jgi:diguanylate cyclase (GGDEF)-like protein/putative nucleotidyltransferase with HDIG domain
MYDWSDAAGANPDLGNDDRRDDVTGAGPGPTEMRAGAAPERMTILLVEDDTPTAHALSQLLGALGHEVVMAADGVEAWSLLQHRRVQVVLADWVMPWMDGLELCRRIRVPSGRPYIYFVLFTCRGKCEDRLEALAAGADDFLAKPFDTRELVARLEIARRLLAVQEDLERKNVSLRELASTDGLTGLTNRRSFFEALESHFALAARQRTPLSLVLLDVDHFKTHNDAFGHLAGDDVLRGVADGLRSMTRAQDTVSRYGGEEFALLLPMTGRVVARAMAERLREAIERRDDPHRPVTASFGVASMTLKTGKALELVAQADRALYASKRRGRNCVTHQADLGDRPGGGGEPADDSRGPQPPLSRMALPSSIATATSPIGLRLVPSGEDPGGRVPTFDDIVEGWSRAMVLRDCETVAHSRQVTSTMLDLARTLGIDEADMVHIRRGSLLHDIGKMGIPDVILHKSGPLSDEEWRIMRRHPGYAVDLLAPFDFLRPALEIPYCHHERWDGTGYPRGLKGEQISLAARAFAAVDIWDALSHDRPYREAWTEDRVRTHITALSGTHLDPDVVVALGRTVVSDGNLALPSHADIKRR